ncbi:citrate lyase subunit alpha [Acetobacter suratthaniensis]|uniref:Citrate lyase alpha chain n=1 Tax=Acetobacter suratthaniensis TaxID=1502841 RepID=A0ABS3LQ89_9PROT|nr:citrate lyase subunit alpha [Acetobacter suratthaniensis]MBO1329538.1 citrate lyase subunit alpha [Acetobacter suratthaniensis]MCX2567404.1 citrate lyase subunit alpha [Acetobacter suratthaniensis]
MSYDKKHVESFSAENGYKKFRGVFAESPQLESNEEKHHRKIFSSIESAVAASGLKDGGTISFHHAFREGDKVLMKVVKVLSDLGFKDLTIASSSLLNCHDGLIEYIKTGVITKIFTSGLRGELGEAISNGLMQTPVQIHSHGGRVHLIQSGELAIDVAFLGVASSDEFGNANGSHGQLSCGSLGYAKVDAQHARYVVVLTQELVDFPNYPASLSQDQVDAVVTVEEVGDPSLISVGAARLTKNPRDLLLARIAASVIEHSGYFKTGFSLQTGSGGAATATTIFLGEKMTQQNIKAGFALGGVTGSIVDLLKKGMIGAIADVQSFDIDAAQSLRDNPAHNEISANQYANASSKGAYVDRVDVVLLSALEVDIDFNVNVLTGSDGVLRGASGGHCDVAAAANLTVIVTPLLRSRIPCVVNSVNTVVTPGQTVDVVVTDHGIAVNPNKPLLEKRLRDARLPVMNISSLRDIAIARAGTPKPIEYLDKVVAIVRYRDGTVLDVVRQVKR